MVEPDTTMDMNTKEWLQRVAESGECPPEALEDFRKLNGYTLKQSIYYMNHKVSRMTDKMREDKDKKTDHEIKTELKKSHHSILIRDRLRRKLASGASGSSNGT